MVGQDISRAFRNPSGFLSDRDTAFRNDPLGSTVRDFATHNPFTDLTYQDYQSQIANRQDPSLPPRQDDPAEEKDPDEDQRRRREELLRLSLLNQGYGGTRSTSPLGTKGTPNTRPKTLLGE